MQTIAQTKPFARPGHNSRAIFSPTGFFKTRFTTSAKHLPYHAAITTTTTSAKTRSAPGLTPATGAEEITQERLVGHLVENFNPLPRISPTPIKLDSLARELQCYPNADFKNELINSFTFGFKIGYSGPEFSYKAYNLKSAETYPHIIAGNILSELKEKRVAGPFVHPPLENFRTSPIGVVPKKDSGKFRTITDLSSPPGRSINDYISDEESSVSFNNFDSAVNIVAKLGQGALLAKLDVKSAFRICPVHPSDWHLLGFSFCDYYFVDLCLPFGLRSSVNRFTQLADTLSWILQNNYNITNVSHYLDNFFLAAPPGSALCRNNMEITKSLFERLGVPLAPEKIVGPTTTLVYLGIEIDAENMLLRLPEDKLKPLLSLLQEWHTKKKCTKRELLSLIGKLSFASKIIPSGRTFLRRLIDLAKSVSKLHHHLSLNLDAQKDIEWWQMFLPSWNGKCKILDPESTVAADINPFTDASGSLGFGIYFDGKWVSCAWPVHLKDFSIQWKELFPIYISCFIWAKSLAVKRILFHCDNASVVNICSTQSSKCPCLANLLRRMFFIAANNQFTINVTHIPGLDNSIADCLSRLQVTKFRQLVPHADQLQTEIPQEAWKF